MEPPSSTSSSSAVGLCLLPSELLYSIFSRLAAPDILRLRSVSKPLLSLLSDDDFRRLCAGDDGGWVFVYKKRPPRDSILRGFNDRAGRWFRFPVSDLLTPPVVPPGEDLYFLAAAGDFFLFASNGRRELLAVNIRTRAVRKIPPSPLGPRGTSSWRRSGLKLVSGSPGSGEFRFLFAELLDGRPYLFAYCSETNTWRAEEAVEVAESSRQPPPPPEEEEKDRIFLSITHFGAESVVVCASQSTAHIAPAIHRPRFSVRAMVGGGVGASSDKLHVYGDGKIAIVLSAAVEGRVRVVVGVEVWGMSRDGREWVEVGRAPAEVVEGARKPYGVMMGCMEESRETGMLRIVLMSNYKGSWDIMWLYYDARGSGRWGWVPVPDTGTKGLNMAGIAISSSLGLFSTAPSSPVSPSSSISSCSVSSPASSSSVSSSSSSVIRAC